MSGILNLLAAAVTTLVTVPSFNAQSVRITPNDALAQFKLGADGHYYKDTGPGYVDQGTWVEPPYMAQFYEARMQLTSGDTLTSGTLTTYQSLDTDRSWSLGNVQNSPNVKTSTLTLDIRRIADTATQGTTTGNILYAEVTN